MAPNNINQSNGKDLWTFSSFATLGGCVFAAYVVKSIIVGFLRTPPELTSFLVSILVALVGLYFTSKFNLKRAILALFNGCLIFFTLVGSTSYFASATDKTADKEFREKKPFAAAFITPLNQDKNLVEKNVAMTGKVRSLDSEIDTMKVKVRSLDSEAVELRGRVRSLDSENESIKRKNYIYEGDLNYLATYIERMSPTAFKKNTILNRISITKNRILQVPIEKKN